MPIKPSESEEEYFKRQELERLRLERDKAVSQTEQSERQRLKELHWMRCPKCGMELTEVDFHKVRVDACFGCDGMFLDAGEIEKILEGHDEPGLLGRMSSMLFGRSGERSD